MNSSLIHMAFMREIVKLFQLEQDIARAKETGNFSLALKKYNEIISIKEKISNKLGLAKTFAEKGHLLNQIGYGNEAYSYFVQALELAKDSKNIDFLNLISHQIDEIFNKEF